jgi:tetratricopeptide (TPR) repeat protein
MIKQIIKTFFILCVLSLTALAGEHFESIYIQGDAGIVIDGKFTDWQKLKTTTLPIENFHASRWDKLPDNAQDLSARFRFLVDGQYLYLAIEVTDDELCFGKELLEHLMFQDAIRILYSGTWTQGSKKAPEHFWKHDGEVIISVGPKGEVQIQGRTPLIDWKNGKMWNTYSKLGEIPNLWDALGVKAAITQGKGQYNVEVAIPVELFGWKIGANPQTLGLNIRVYDKDPAKGPEEEVLTWANDPTWGKGIRRLNSIGFKQGGKGKTLKEVESKRKQVVALYEQFSTAKIEQPSAVKNQVAVASLTTPNAEPWSLPLLARLQFVTGQVDQSIETLNQIKKNEDTPLQAWVTEQLAKAYESSKKKDMVGVEAKKLTASNYEFQSASAARVITNANEPKANVLSNPSTTSQDLFSLAAKKDNPHIAKQLLYYTDKLKGKDQLEKRLEAYKRITQMKGATLGTKAQALLRLQQIYSERRDLANEWKLALELQRIGHDDSLHRKQGLLSLRISYRYRKRQGLPLPGELSTIYRSVLKSRKRIGPTQLIELGNILEEERKIAEAITEYKNVLNMTKMDQADKASALIAIQRAEFKLKKYKESFQTGLKIQKTYLDEYEQRLDSMDWMRLSMGKGGATQAEYAAAETEFINRLSGDVKTGNIFEVAKAHLLLGQLYKHKRDYANAIKELNAALATEVEAEEVKQMALYHLANVEMAQQQWNKAIEHLEQLLSLNPVTHLGGKAARALAECRRRSGDKKGYVKEMTRLLIEHRYTPAAERIRMQNVKQIDAKAKMKKAQNQAQGKEE